LLRLGDRFAWAAACHDGNERTQEIMRDWNGGSHSAQMDEPLSLAPFDLDAVALFAEEDRLDA
jgi:hypothetical protein